MSSRPSSDVLLAKLASLTDEQRTQIREHVERIAASSAFSGSRRCQAFLRLVIDHALQGRFEMLRERMLGVELFARPVDYETATDAVVRVKASEVRRRLAQFYADAAEKPGLRIELPTGGYFPEFHWPPLPANKPVGEEYNDIEILPLVIGSASDITIQRDLRPTGEPEPGGETGFGRRRWIWAVGLSLTIVALAAFGVWWKNSDAALRSPIDAFWAPVIKQSAPVMILIGSTQSTWLSPRLRRAIREHPQAVSIHPGDVIEMANDSVPAGSLQAIQSITQALERRGQRTLVRWMTEAQPREWRESSMIFVSGFNTASTPEMNQDLRFVFEHKGEADGPTWMIKDRFHPERTWSLPQTPAPLISKDYGVVTRILDRNHQRVTVSLGGLNQFGTQMAAEFTADPNAWSELQQSAPRDWTKKNLQIVLEGEISNRHPGRPRVVATYFW